MNQNPCDALNHTHYVCPFRYPHAVIEPGPHTHGNKCPNATAPECPMRGTYTANVMELNDAMRELAEALPWKEAAESLSRFMSEILGVIDGGRSIGVDEYIFRLVVPAGDWSADMDDMELSWIEKKTELEPVPEPEPEPHRCSKMHEDIRFDFGSPVDDDWWLSEQRDGHWHPIQDFDKCPLCGWVPPSGKEETADEWVPIGDVKPGSIVEVRGGGQCVWTNKRSLVSLHTGSINNRVHSTEFKVIAPPQ